MRKTILFLLALLAAAPACAIQMPVLVVSAITPVPYDPDARAYIKKIADSGGAVPAAPFRRAIANFIRAEKGWIGNWSTMDAGYIYNTADPVAATINVYQPGTLTATKGGTCTLTVTHGLDGDGSTCNFDYGAGTGLGRATQNNFHADIYNITGQTNLPLGGNSSTNQNVLLNNPGTSVFRCPATSSATQTGFSGGGATFCDRSSSSTISVGNNGAVVNASLASTSAAFSSTHITLCEVSGSVFCSAEHIAWTGLGQALTATQEANQYQALHTLVLQLGGVGY